MPPLVIRESEFQQISGGFGSAQRTVKENKGNIKAPTSVPVQTYAVSLESPSYRGEYYLGEQNGEVGLGYWSPNKLIFKVKVNSKDLLVINQNYFPGWKAKANPKVRKVINHNGLLATYIYPEDDEIIFYYFPDTFLFGTLVSILGIALSFLFWKKVDLRCLKKKLWSLYSIRMVLNILQIRNWHCVRINSFSKCRGSMGSQKGNIMKKEA